MVSLAIVYVISILLCNCRGVTSWIFHDAQGIQAASRPARNDDVTTSHATSDDVKKTGFLTFRNPCAISHDDVYGGYLVDCSNREIFITCSDDNNIPEIGPFPVNTTTLVLDNNTIPCLPNKLFQKLTSLRKLSIRSCHMKKIQRDALVDLKDLDVLNLEYNELDVTTDTSFPDGIFRNIPRLNQLLIAYNLPKQPQKDQTLYRNIGSLRELRNLSIDALSELRIGPEFASLTNLSELTLSCKWTTNVTNNSFFGLRDVELQVLNILAFQFNMLVNFEKGVFQYVPHVKSLKIEDSEIGNQKIMETLYPFENRNMTYLKIQRSNFRESYSVPSHAFQDGIVNTTTTKSLLKICMSHFIWTDSLLFAIGPHSLNSGDVWPKCVKYIDFSRNMLSVAGWWAAPLDVQKFINLEELVLSSRTSSYEVTHPKLINYTVSYSSSEATRSNDLTDPAVSSSVVTDSSISETDKFPGSSSNPFVASEKKIHNNLYHHGNQSSVASSFPSEEIPQTHEYGWRFYFPKNVRVIRVVETVITDPVRMGNKTYIAKHASKLSELYWINNYLIMGHPKLLGLEKLRLLDVSGSGFIVGVDIFDHFTGLEVFVLKSMRPATFFRDMPCRRILRHLSNLRYLDISNNKLNDLEPEAFSNNPKLSHLILADNRFSSIPFDLESTPNLEYLDLSGNAFSFLDQAAMDVLSSHVSKGKPLMLNLQGNKLSCVCLQIRFLVWLQQTSVNLVDKSKYTCMTEDGFQARLADLDIPYFWVRCEGRFFFMTTLVFASLMIAAFLGFYLVMRFRTSLEAFVLRIFVKAFRPMAPRDYKFHVFIGYADDDVIFVRHILRRYLEETLKVTTFIHHRDLRVGYTDQQFFAAISRSWRVLLVLSKTFILDYDMAHIVMKYASHSVTAVNQDRVFVLVEESQLHAIPDYLDGVLDDTKIIVLPDLHTELNYEQRQKIKNCLRPD